MLALGRADALDLVDARVGTAAGHRDVDTGGGLRLPLEADVTDGHGRPGLCALLDQFRLDTRNGFAAVPVRQLRLATQSEGCVADDRTGMLYVAEEDVGIWRFAADPAAPATPISGPRVDGRFLVADAEGLALAPSGRNGGYLIASSQGDNAYAVWRLPDLAPVGRFRIAAGKFGATSETDGIEVMLGNFGPGFPGGLMVAQDGDNAPQMQNFKLVAWSDVQRALAGK